jgi:hypothetical protein
MTPEETNRKLKAQIELKKEQLGVLRELNEVLGRGDVLKIGELMERYADIETELAKVQAGVSERLNV